MMQRLFCASLALLAGAWAQQGRAADFQFPSVPVGQGMHAEFRVTTSGGAPIAGIDVSLRVPAGCGQVSPDRVTTDSSGTGRFDFFAGSQPGVCTITGSNGGTTLSGATTIFRPAELAVGGNPLIDDWRWEPGKAPWFALTLTAGGLPLPLVRVDLGQFGPGGPTLLGSTQVATDASGALRIDVREGSTAGIYDLPLIVAGETRHLRLVQRTFPDSRLSLPYRQTVGGSNDPAVVVLPDGAAGPCAMGGVATSFARPSAGPPPGMADFFNDLIELSVTCTGPRSARVRIEYPDPIPADGQLWWYRFVQGTGFRYEKLPADVSGNAVTFTIPEFIDRGIFLEATVGIALPGASPAPAPPRVHDMWWGGFVENGWGMSIVQSPSFPGRTFAALYAYDSAGEPTWWVMTLGDWATARGPQFTAPAYSATGSPWYAYEPGIIYVGDPAGRVRLNFSDANNGEMSFTLNGVAGHKRIERMLFGPPSSTTRPDVSGLWWGGFAQNGWGISVLQQYDKLFSVWYTYDAANKPRWFVMPDGRWTSATTWEGRIYRVQGSPWLGAAYDSSKLKLTDVGAFTMNFAPQGATFTYSMDGRSGTMRIERNTSY